jgi:hypothetical protein
MPLSTRNQNTIQEGLHMSQPHQGNQSVQEGLPDPGRDFQDHGAPDTPMKRPLKQRFIAWGAAFRGWMNRTRNKNPVIFDNLSKTLAIVTNFLGLFVAFFCSVPWAALILILASLLMLMAQWVLITNKYEKKYLNFANFNQELSSKISSNLFLCNDGLQPYNTPPLLFDNFLESTAKDLEDILSDYYKKEVRATIKLLSLNENEEKRLKTHGRGPNSVVSRGGKPQADMHDSQYSDVSKNYSYNRVINDKWTFFMEGNLKQMTNGDTFVCEYTNWDAYFLSTIVFPIRTPITSNQSQQTEYSIIGAICIDCETVTEEWRKRARDINDNFALSLLSTMANYLYRMCTEYLQGMDKPVQMKSRPVISHIPPTPVSVRYANKLSAIKKGP